MSQIAYFSAGKREQTKLANRLAILEAARGAFGELGFEAATVRDIIRRTNLSVGAFYNYYRSKEEVFDALADEGARRFRPILEAQSAKATDFESYLRAAVRAYFDFLASEQEAWLVEASAREPMPHARNTPEIRAVFEDVRTVFADVMERGLAPKVDLDYLAASCIAIAREIGDRMIERRPMDVDGAAEFVVRLILGGLPALPRVDPSGPVADIAPLEMRALLVERLAPDYGGCAVRVIETPIPGPGEVRIEVRAAAVNFPDLLMTRGEYQHKPELPFIPGLELSGEVEALGEGVDTWRIGDAVVGGARIGGFSQYAVAPAAALRAKPERLSFAQASAYGAAYLTAWVALVRRARLEAGEWVLVHGAAGGVGLACVDLAKALGARVIAASASDQKLAVVAAEYAPDACVNVDGGFRDQVKAITGGQGADVIFDPVGGDVFDESVRCIAFDGRLLVVGFTSGRIPTVGANLPLIKGFSVVGVRAGEYGRRFPDRGRENLEAVWTLAEQGRTRPRVHAEFALDDWRSAFDLLADRKVIGKAVIRPDR